MDVPLLPERRVSKWIPTVEPVIFLVSLAAASGSITIQTFIIQRICEFTFGKDESINVQLFCTNLSQYNKQEAEVESLAGSYSTYKMIITSGPPLILALFWGQLNDRWGSKGLMFVPLGGFVLTNIMFYALTYFPRSHPSWLLVALLPTGLTGGAVTLTVCIFKLVVHDSSPEDRTFRIGVAEGAMLISTPIGLFMGSKLVSWGGFKAVFATSGILEVVAMLYVLLFVVNDEGKEVHSGGSGIVRWLSMDRFRDSLKVFTGPYKFLILILVTILSIRTVVMSGNGTIMYMYTRYRFGWDQSSFSTYFTYDGTLAALGVLTVSTVALKKFHVADALLGTICCTTFVIGCTVWALAVKPWLMYLGSTIQLCEGISIIIVRSMISRVVPSEDVGKALSFLAIPESLMPFISTPLYNATYVATIHTFIGTAFMLSVGLNSFVVVAFAYIYLLYPKDVGCAPNPQVAPAPVYTSPRATQRT